MVLDTDTGETLEPKTRGYSLRTRSQAAGSTKENIKSVTKPINNKTKRATGANNVLKDSNIEPKTVPSTRKTRGQLKLETEINCQKESEPVKKVAPKAKRNGRKNQNKKKESTTSNEKENVTVDNTDDEEKKVDAHQIEVREDLETVSLLTDIAQEIEHVSESTVSKENVGEIQAEKEDQKKPEEEEIALIPSTDSIESSNEEELQKEPQVNLSKEDFKRPHEKEPANSNFILDKKLSPKILKNTQEKEINTIDNQEQLSSKDPLGKKIGNDSNEEKHDDGDDYKLKFPKEIVESTSKKIEHDKKKKEKEKQSFFNLPKEEQILIVRKKLERIIHKKEAEEKKAIDLLRILERMEITEELLLSTKIDLTLEAMKFIIKDKEINRRTDNLLKILRKVKKVEHKQVKDSKWREPEGAKVSEAVKKDDNLSSKSLLHWMDKFMENDKKLDSLNKKFDSLKSGVNEIKPSDYKIDQENNVKKCNNEDKKKDKSKTDLMNKTDLKDNLAKKEEISKTEKDLMKLLKSINKMSKDDDKVYYYLKDISYLNLRKEIVEKTKLSETLKMLKTSSNEKTSKLARKVSDKIKGRDKSADDIDNIANKMKTVKLKDSKSSESSASKESNILDLTRRVENISIKSGKAEKTSSKLFATPFKFQNTQKVTEPQQTACGGDQQLLIRLKQLEIENNLHKIKLKLDNYKPNKDDSQSWHEVLKDLQKADVTLELLESTKIGLSLNSFRKCVEDKELAHLGKDIIRKWKSLVPVTKKEASPEEVSESLEKQNEDNVEKIRSHCRSLLSTSLNSNSSIPDTCKVDTDKLAAAIEEAIFERFKETNQKYRSQVHSRQYNIKTNQNLRENLVVGNISPDEIAVMTHEDMANDDLKKMREDLVKKGFDCLPKSHMDGDKFCNCRICLPPWIQQ